MLFAAAAFLPAALRAEPNDPTRQQIDSIIRAGKTFEVRVPNRCFAILDINLPRTLVGGERKLFSIPTHPGLDSLFTEAELAQIRAEIDSRCDSLGKDSLLTSELFWVMRPYFDRLYHEDPHYRISMPPYGDPAVYPKRRNRRRLERQLCMPAFVMLQINDTLLVDRSLDPAFRRGDMIAAINGVPAAEYLKYSYHDRYMLPVSLMGNYFYGQIVDRFRIDLIRNEEALTVETTGSPGLTTSFKLDLAESMDNNIRTYPEAACGYIAIPQFFPSNSRLIRIVHKTLLDFKKEGLTHVILDLRRNPGGCGHAFDKLLSIFIDKPVVEYCTGRWVKASKQAMKYYDFLTEEMLGQVVPLPDEEVVRSFETTPGMYVGGMRYYVLISRDTGSIAASFVNMLQYHGAAELAGEPLLHNALKYGETLDGSWLEPTGLYQNGLSMVRIDECTQTGDGILRPDIPIPYVAADHLSGRDALLDKLLELIRSRN